jgi:hypothetical protein
LTSDALEYRSHRGLGGRIAVVELQCVGPTGEVRIAPVGEDSPASPLANPRVVVRRFPQVGFCAFDEILGMGLDPRMVQRGVVRDEIEHQTQTALTQSLPNTGKRRLSTKRLVHRVAGDGEAGSSDVIFAEVGERFFELRPPLGLFTRYALPGSTGLPNAQQPYPVETRAGESIQLLVWNVVERGRPAKIAGQICQPYSGVHLEEGRIARSCDRLYGLRWSWHRVLGSGSDAELMPVSDPVVASVRRRRLPGQTSSGPQRTTREHTATPSGMPSALRSILWRSRRSTVGAPEKRLIGGTLWTVAHISISSPVQGGVRRHPWQISGAQQRRLAEPDRQSRRRCRYPLISWVAHLPNSLPRPEKLTVLAAPPSLYGWHMGGAAAAARAIE